MRYRINRVDYILVTLAILPVFLHAQFKVKNTIHNTLMKPLFKGQSLPDFSFLLPGFKKNTDIADTIRQVDRKTNLSDTLSSGHLTDNKYPDLYTQTFKNRDSNYPAFQNYYLKLTDIIGIISENKAKLSWQTDINEDVRYFFIERSTDRKNFNKVGEIDCAMKTSIKNFYFIDSSISNSLLYYYQVKALLIDGSSMVSDFIPVKNSMVELKASLSPASGNDLLVLNTNQPVRRIEIINMDGQVVFRNKKVSQEEPICIREYLPGSYTLKIVGHNGFVTQLFFKKADSNK